MAAGAGVIMVVAVVEVGISLLWCFLVVYCSDYCDAVYPRLLCPPLVHSDFKASLAVGPGLRVPRTLSGAGFGSGSSHASGNGRKKLECWTSFEYALRNSFERVIGSCCCKISSPTGVRGGGNNGRESPGKG